MSIGSSNIEEKPCGCCFHKGTGFPTHFCDSHEPHRDKFTAAANDDGPLEIDIDNLRAENAYLKRRVALLENLDATRLMNAQVLNALEFVGLNCCRWRAECKCLLDCPGSVVCNTSGLALVDDNGQPVGERP
jgi:hypothetical protein